jgi:hypothetical protein
VMIHWRAPGATTASGNKPQALSAIAATAAAAMDARLTLTK